ncbi:MAG: PepSY-associated TM helix domain-containing protein [Pseudomonadota bacterium]
MSGISGKTASFFERVLPRMRSVAERFKKTDEASNPPPKKKSKRRKLYDLHTWVGFHLAVVMVVVLFTGTFATVSNELDWLFQHDMRVVPDGEKVSWQEMLEALEASNPTATVAGISQMEGDHFAYRSQVLKETGVFKFVHVNQWTGEVTGETGYFTIQRFFRDLHRYLFLPKTFGLTIVCSMAIILGISLYTGLKTSRNWRTLMTRIRFSKGARTAIGDAHKAVGLWSIWFFVLMISTGLWYYAEFLGKGFEPAAPQTRTDLAEVSRDITENPSLTDVMNVVKAAYPELEIKGFTFSVTAGSPIVVSGKAGNPIVRSRANAVYVHPETLEVIEVRRSKDLGWLQWLNQIADPLHFGSFAGLPIKLIWFVFGLFMTGLSVSGVWLTWRRLKSRGASWMQIAILPVLVISALFCSFHITLSQLPIVAGMNPLPHAWFITGVFLAAGALLFALWLRRRFRTGRWLTLKNAAISILSITMMAGAAHATLLQNPFKQKEEAGLGMIEAGPVRAELYLRHSPHGIPDGDVRITVSSDTGRLNLTNMTIRLLKSGEELGSEEDRVEKNFQFLAVTQLAFLDLPRESLLEATDIEATFEMKTGNQYSVTWPMPLEESLRVTAQGNAYPIVP